MARDNKKESREMMEEPSRMDSDRELKEEIERISRTYKMGWQSPFHVDPKTIPHGWEYIWALESLWGVPDRDRINSLMGRGWTPVPTERHPELCSMDLLGRQVEFKNYIYKKGLMLLQRPTIFGEKERAYIESHNRMIERSMPGLQSHIIPADPAGYSITEQPSRFAGRVF